MLSAREMSMVLAQFKLTLFNWMNELLTAAKKVTIKKRQRAYLTAFTQKRVLYYVETKKVY